MPMFTTPKRLWRDKEGKATGSESRGVELLAGEWDRVDLTLAEAQRLRLVDKDGNPLPAEDDAPPQAKVDEVTGSHDARSSG